MKKITCLSFLIVFLLAFVQTQAQNKVSVFLKDGSIISGRIVEQYPDSIVKILSNGNIWVFRMSEVEKIDGKLTSVVLEDKNGVRAVATFFVQGDGAGVKGQIGYRFGNHYTASLGIGSQQTDGVAFTPLFTDFRYDFKTTRKSPFVYAQAGYAWGDDSYYYDYGWYQDYEFRGGIYAAGGLGLKTRYEKIGIEFTLGYGFQTAYKSYGYFQQWEPPIISTVENHYMYHRVLLGFGLSF